MGFKGSVHGVVEFEDSFVKFNTKQLLSSISPAVCLCTFRFPIYVCVKRFRTFAKEKLTSILKIVPKYT